MSVLVLHHRGSLRGTPYDRWLSDHGEDVLLLASRRHLQLVGEELPRGTSGYRHMEALDGYEAGGVVEARAVQLAREYRVRHIVACQEHDLERAAQLRELFGLPGQRLDTVIPYRDKLVIKHLARSAGVPVPPHRDVECAADLLAFARAHGFPLVVRPRDGAGTTGLRVLTSPADLDRFLAGSAHLHEPYQPNLLVEAFLPSALCHVDGLVAGGRLVYAWPSQYLFPLDAGRDEPPGRMEATLEPGDPLARRLLELTDRLLAALPRERHFAFQATVFHTDDDRLVLCEVACRPGSGGDREVQRALFGLDPAECWVRAQLGLPLRLGAAAGPLRPSTMAGQVVLVKRPGRVRAVPGEPPFPWVHRASVVVRPGQVLGPPTSGADLMAWYVVTAPARAECERRMRRLEAWVLDGLVLEPVPGGNGAAPD